MSLEVSDQSSRLDLPLLLPGKMGAPKGLALLLLGLQLIDF